MPQGVQINLTSKESLFVDFFAETGDAEAALQHAGYAASTRPDLLLNRPLVIAAVQYRTHMKLAGEGAATSIGYLLAVAKQGLAHVKAGQKPTREYNAAAIALADRSGFSVRSQQVRDENDAKRELSDMTQDELRAFIDKGEEELARRAKDVNAAIDALPQGEVIDLFS